MQRTPTPDLINAARAYQTAQANFTAVARADNAIRQAVLAQGQYPSIEGGVVTLPAYDWLIETEHAAAYYAALDAAYQEAGLPDHPGVAGEWKPGYTPSGIAQTNLQRATDALLDAIAEWSGAGVSAEECRRAPKIRKQILETSMTFLQRYL